MKRLIYIILWLIIAISLAYGVYRPKGDINGDRKVTITDLVQLSQYLAELRELTPYQLYRADMNNDGVIDILDLALLQIKLAKGE